jgi:uncharacterized protein YqhQ
MSGRETRKRLHVGGQAVIEGVMMRSPARIATAVRNPEGKIVVKVEPFVSLTKRHRILNTPIIRGAIALVETLVIAVKALSFSAEQATAESAEDGRSKDSGRRLDLSMAVIATAALVLGLVIFFYIPLKLTEWIGFESGFFFNLVDGLFRLVFIFLYIVLVSSWKEMHRVFEYHGAEHKTIYAFEEEGQFTPETVLKYPKVHPRCSTSFILLVVIVSILLFIILGRPTTLSDRIVRFSFIPLIGGVSYELLRLSTRPFAKRRLSFIFWPGLSLQRLTTREPSLDQIEVAITALRASLDNKSLEP